MRHSALLLLCVAIIALLVQPVCVGAAPPDPLSSWWPFAPGHALRAPADPPPWPQGCQECTLGRQALLTCTPRNWNGQLVLYAHGYVPSQAPLSLPQELDAPDQRAVLDILLASGFAFATTSYSRNGYVMDQAVSDLNSVVDYYKAKVAPGPVKQVLVMGPAEGGLVATLLVEQHPQIYAGALAIGAPLAGLLQQVSHLGDFRVVFDRYFPDILETGAARAPEDVYLYWHTQYAPAIAAAIRADAWATEKLFAITRVPVDPADSAVNTALGILWHNIVSCDDLLDRAKGQPFGNQYTRYSGSDDDVALNARVERVRPDLAARGFIKRSSEPSGKLQRPLVSLHTTGDGVVPFKHELLYADKVTRAGRSTFFTVLPVSRYGHCTVTPQEVLGALALLSLQTNEPASDGLVAYLSALPDRLE